jgi:hypothetical protein
MGLRLRIILGLLLVSGNAFAANTAQVVGRKFPPTTVSGLANYLCPAGTSCTALVTDATAFNNGGTLTGGGSVRARVTWNGSAWVGISGGASASCPAGSTLWTTGVSDHKGITFGSCSGTRGTSNYACTYTQPVTCTTTSGSASYTISGYTPSSADIGKHLVIGMSAGIGGSTNTVGAGGNTTGYAGQPLRVKVSSVSGQTITGTTFSGGSSSANAAESVTNAECDLETDNAPTMTTALSNLGSSGGTLCVPPGQYGFDSGVEIQNNATIYCQPGAVFYDARNDSYQGNFGAEELFWWYGTTGGGVNGCTYVGTNTVGQWTIPAYADEPNRNHPYYTFNSSNLTFQHMIDMNVWADSDLELSADGDVAGKSSNYNIVNDVYTQQVDVAGPSVIIGNNNLFENLVGRDACIDLEPNNSTESGNTYSNTFNNDICINDRAYSGATQLGASFGNCYTVYGGGGQCCGSCATTQAITNNTFIGDMTVWMGCASTSSGPITDTWTGNTAVSNSTGKPSCECDSACNAGGSSDF